MLFEDVVTSTSLWPQICRLAYEMMQQYHADASGYFTSLDSIHFLQGHENKLVALEAHAPRTREEMELRTGDRISVKPKEYHNFHNGYYRGRNKRSSRVGLYPLYKVEEEIRTVKMPTYPEAVRDDH